MGSPNEMDFGGLDLRVRSIISGSTGPSIAGYQGRPTITGVGATLTLTPELTNGVILLNRAAGCAITLPQAAPGLSFLFLVTVSVTSNAYKISTAIQGTEFFLGPIVSVDTDTSNALAYDQVGNGTSHDNISMAGTTTGGLIGTWIEIFAISTTQWLCRGVNYGSGSVGTPFATT